MCGKDIYHSNIGVRRDIDWFGREYLLVYFFSFYFVGKIVKKNTIESVLMRWMKLEPIIQSEVSQKEKHQYSILMACCNSWGRKESDTTEAT